MPDWKILLLEILKGVTPTMLRQMPIPSTIRTGVWGMITKTNVCRYYPTSVGHSFLYDI